MSILGDWDVTIKTPIGSLAVVYTFTEHDGTLAGTGDRQGRNRATARHRR